MIVRISSFLTLTDCLVLLKRGDEACSKRLVGTLDGTCIFTHDYHIVSWRATSTLYCIVSATTTESLCMLIVFYLFLCSLVKRRLRRFELTLTSMAGNLVDKSLQDLFLTQNIILHPWQKCLRVTVKLLIFRGKSILQDVWRAYFRGWWMGYVPTITILSFLVSQMFLDLLPAWAWWDGYCFETRLSWSSHLSCMLLLHPCFILHL